ncbi:MAG TPA: HD domain-containing protein [Gemmatimonadaceae bacterium]|nr:HD domain-containing protein [Gemmatimonadaceae bacterium]HRQ76979.1 HD domain-containing protein [Gemmatimonadaceae bacterium]
MTGYSDRINHAFAYAAKHHDRAVRKGTRLPYLTQPANVALILTRYGQDEDTVVAGILHDVVEDCQREGWTQEMLDERVAAKFGDAALRAAVAVTRRKHDDDGVELSRDDVRSDCLARLASAGEPARWVFAADKVHHAGSLLADLRRTFDPEAAWSRLPGGRAGVLQWYREALARLRAIGFSAPIVDELAALVDALEER